MKQKIKDPKLKKAVEDFYKALEAYYPEHKVFALDSIDNGLREK